MTNGKHIMGDLTRKTDPFLTTRMRQARLNRKLLLMSQARRLAEAKTADELRALLDKLTGRDQ